MKYILLQKVLLISLCFGLMNTSNVAEATPQKTNAVYSSEDVSLRFHAQWNVDEGTRKRLHKAYGAMRIKFDPNGHPIPHGLSATQIKRWERLYQLCMSDGCTYCDANEGSCELGTCGPNNKDCRPHIGTNGHPTCGYECADYAFTSILTCNDLS